MLTKAPGGKADEEDPDIVFTALREANEETGMLPSQVSRNLSILSLNL